MRGCHRGSPAFALLQGGAAPADGRRRQASTQDTARRKSTGRPAQNPPWRHSTAKRHVRHPQTAHSAPQNGTFGTLKRHVLQHKTAYIAKCLCLSAFAPSPHRPACQGHLTKKSPCICFCGVSSPPQTHGLPGLNSDYKEKSKYNTPLRRTYPMLSQKAGPRLARNIELKYHKVLIYFSMARRKDTKKYFKSTRFCLKIFLFRKYFSLKARFRQPNTRRWPLHRRHFAPS